MSATASPNAILSPIELQRLEQLRLSPRRKFAGRMRGERISRQKGISVEFADYRDYTNGDDLRHLDWNILARLDRPTIRTYQDEDDLAVYILLDNSSSMDFGNPTKLSAAVRIAVALGFIGLCGQDRVTPMIMGNVSSRSFRGRSSITPLTNWANSIQIQQTASFSQSVANFIKMSGTRPGLVICISDTLDPNAPSALRTIGARGHELLMVQVLSDIDIDPEMEGDLRLIDSESQATVDMTAHSEPIAIYKQNLARHCADIEDAVHRSGGRYLRIVSDANLLDIVTSDLRGLGVIE